MNADHPSAMAHANISQAAVPHVVVVGAGFSGTLTAVNLAARNVRVTLMDRSGLFAQGLAYGTYDAVHRLNVRASGMSAYPGDPGHFTRWLTARGGGTGASFAARMLYRAYLDDVLRAAGDAITLRTDDVLAIEQAAVRLASGGTLDADAVVVAVGNLPPQRFSALVGLSVPHADDPWSEEGRRVLDALAGQAGDVLLIGTGLTAVDAVLGLDARGFRGRIIALSRRGLLPRAHADVTPVEIPAPLARMPVALLRWARAQVRVHPWRAVIDSLRPLNQSIWKGWSDAERGAFLRHLRPWWDVHRHRIAPDVSDRLHALADEGRLLVRAGRVAHIADEDVTIRARGAASGEHATVAGVINCTGPAGDIRRGNNALLGDMIERGLARTDGFGLGLEIDDALRVVSDSPRPIYAIGPMTRGALWEAVAVPEIRVQAEMLAATIVRDLAGVRLREATW